MYRSFSGDTGAWQYREQEVISEHTTQEDAERARTALEYGIAPESQVGYYVRKMKKQVTYY